MRVDRGFVKRNLILIKIVSSMLASNQFKKYRKELIFMLRKGLNTYPYDFVLKYNLNDEKVYRDQEGPYVIHNGRKLYFPDTEKYSDDVVLKTHLLSRIEQDIESPHRYLDADEDMNNVVFLDIGCQEASLPLEFVDRLKHLYLFEVENEWNNPLSLSFSDWKDKVTIVNKFVGRQNNDHEIKISDYINNLIEKKELDPFKDRVFVKMDIEGAEEEVFADLTRVMNKLNHISVALCVYHKRTAESKIMELLPEGYVMRVRDTFMLFNPYDRDFKFPYFRHGVARIERGVK